MATVSSTGATRPLKPKRYDASYFERWYRKGPFGDPEPLDRKVSYALSSAEYLLQREVRSVLDVGCGEGPWSDVVKRLRPAARYVGVDPSEYAVTRYGEARGLRLGGLGDLDDLGLTGPFDLIVCVDVIPYVPDADVKRGFASIARLLGGVAFLEIWTGSDRIQGDLVDFRKRRATTYERWLEGVGILRVGPHLYAGPDVLVTLTELESPPQPR